MSTIKTIVELTYTEERMEEYQSDIHTELSWMEAIDDWRILEENYPYKKDKSSLMEEALKSAGPLDAIIVHYLVDGKTAPEIVSSLKNYDIGLNKVRQVQDWLDRFKMNK